MSLPAPRPLGDADLGPAAELAAAAFERDPCWVHVFPDAASRRRLMALLFRSSLRLDRDSGAEVSVVEAAGRLEGVSVWSAPGDPGAPSWRWCLEARLLSALLVRPLSGAKALDVLRAIEGVRPRTLGYLKLLAVAPAAQGRGLGAALLDGVLARSRAREAGVYLETFRPENVAYYGRFGFKERLRVRSPYRPDFWTMSRPAG